MPPLRQVPRTVFPGALPPKLPPGLLSINEVYFTIQGECGFMGAPTAFVRTSHCNLRCVWCDSKYTFYDGTPRSTEDVIAQVAAFPTKHVCLTGGEPLLQDEAFRLVRLLVERGYVVEVETSGSVSVAPFNAWPEALRSKVVVNLDVKCPGSAMSEHNDWMNLAELRPHDQLKFILADRGDYEYAKDVLARHRVAATVFFHPVWKQLEAAEIADWVKADGLTVRVGVQLHKYLWGDRRGI